MPIKPTFGHEDIRSPSDLTKLTDVQLNNLMNRVTIMADYLGYELAKADIEQLELEHQYEIATATLYLSTKASNKKYSVIADEANQELREKLNTAIAKFKLLSSIVEGYDRQYKALSRDQTRRQTFAEKRKSL